MEDQEITIDRLVRNRANELKSRGEQRRELNRVVTRIKDIFDDNGEEFDENDPILMIANKPEYPSFPIIITFIAVGKDLIDSIDFSGIGAVITTIISFVYGVIIFFWTLKKIKGGWWKKRIIRWLWTRYVIILLIEFIPFVKIIPATTIYVLMAHYRETKIVRLMDLALDELRRAGILKYVK